MYSVFLVPTYWKGIMRVNTHTGFHDSHIAVTKPTTPVAGNNSITSTINLKTKKLFKTACAQFEQLNETNCNCELCMYSNSMSFVSLLLMGFP